MNEKRPSCDGPESLMELSSVTLAHCAFRRKPDRLSVPLRTPIRDLGRRTFSPAGTLRPPLLAISRCRCPSIDAKPRFEVELVAAITASLALFTLRLDNHSRIRKFRGSEVVFASGKVIWKVCSQTERVSCSFVAYSARPRNHSGDGAFRPKLSSPIGAGFPQSHNAGRRRA